MSAISNKRVYSFHPPEQDQQQVNINLEQSREFIIEVHQHDNMEEKCRKLTEINLNLGYNIGLLEVELEALKKFQHDKIAENNRVKDKVKQKLEKQQDLRRHLIAQSAKMKKLAAGLKLLTSELQQMSKKEQEIRQNRVNAQETKNKKYQSYNNVEKEYRELIERIKQRDGLQEALEQEFTRNEELKNQIDQIENCLNEERSFRENADIMRRQRAGKVKELNQKVLALEKEEISLKNEINQIERSQMIWQHERQKIQQKSAQAIKIYQQIQESKSNLAAKKLEFSQLDSTFKQICIEENRVRKQIFLQKQCEEERRRYKETLKKKPMEHVQRQGNNHSPVPSKQLENLQSGSSYHNLLKRYQNMNRKK